MNRRAWLLATLACALLSACGFHLRGVGGELRPLPFASLWLASAGSQLHPHLERQLRFRPDVQMVSQANAAEAVLSVTEERTAKDILTINRGGKVNEYELTYRVTVRLSKNGHGYGEPITVLTRREFSYTDSQVLGKEQEEQLLFRDMRDDAATQIVRRLAALKPVVEPDAVKKP